jgi:RNA polymerase sigma-70 factor (ECF subfamily)
MTILAPNKRELEIPSRPPSPSSSSSPSPSRLSASGPSTFDQIFRAQAATVARWAARLGGPDIDPDEVVQEVFLVVQRRLPEFRGDAKLTTWLFRITAKTVSNHRRSAGRRRLWARITQRIADETASRDPSPGDSLEQRESSRRFYEVLDALSPRHREVLTLFELEELGTEEIARVLDRPHATVRVWLHRARHAFVRRWQDRQEEDDRETTE